MGDQLQDRRLRSIHTRAEMYLSELNRAGLRHAQAAHDTRHGVILLEKQLSGGGLKGNEYTELARLDTAHSLQSAHVQTMAKEHAGFINALQNLQGCTSLDVCDASIQNVINASSVITPSRVEARVLMQRLHEYWSKSIAQLKQGCDRAGVSWPCGEGGDDECLERLMLELRKGRDAASTELLEKARRVKQRLSAVVSSIKEKEHVASTIENAETVLHALRVQASELTNWNEARLNGILGHVKQELESAIEESRGSDVQLSEVRVKRAAYQAKVDELQTKLAELKRDAAECRETTARLQKRVKELQASGSPEELRQCVQEDGLYIPACVNARFHELQQKVSEIRAGVEASQELSRRINECSQKLQDEMEASQGLKEELDKSKKALEESIRKLKSCEAESKRCMDACKVSAEVVPQATEAAKAATAEAAPPVAADPINKFRRQLAVGVPRPAVEAKMVQEGLDPALLDTPPPVAAVPAVTAAEPDPKYAKYFKMLGMGLPKGAVIQAMTRDGLTDFSVLDQVGAPAGQAPPGGLPPPQPRLPMPGVPRLPAEKAVPRPVALFKEAFALIPETVQNVLSKELTPKEIAAQKREEEDTVRLEKEKAAQIAKSGLGRFKSVFAESTKKDAKFYQQYEILLKKLFKSTASELVEWIKDLKFSPAIMESVKEREKITLALNVFSELNKIATKDGAGTDEVRNIVETDTDATTGNPYDRLLYMLILTRNLKTDKKSSIRVILDQLSAVDGMVRYTSQKSEFEEKRARFNNAIADLESMVTNVLKAADCVYPKQRKNKWTDFPLPVFATVGVCTGNTIPPALKLGSPVDILSSSMTTKVMKPSNRQWLCPDGSFLQMLKGLWEVAHATASVPLTWDWTLNKFPSWEELKDTDTAVGMKTSVSEMLQTLKVVKAADASANLNVDALKDEYNRYMSQIESKEKRVTGMYSFEGNVYELVKKALDIVSGFDSARSSSLNTYVNNMKMFVQGNPANLFEWYNLPLDAWKTVQAQVAKAATQQREAAQAASRAARQAAKRK
jgi:hypothetical protein